MPPFGDRVSADPSFEEMETVVCHQKVRPEQPKAWKDCEIMSILSRIQSECWLENQHARLSIVRVKKLLKQCQQLLEEKYSTMGLKVCDEIGNLIDEVPLRHKEREEAKIAEENEKRRQEELRRKQQGNFCKVRKNYVLKSF